MTLFLASAFPLSLPSEAQEPQGGDAPQKEPVVATGTKSWSIPHKVCPDTMAIDVTEEFPKDTGNAQVDKFFAKVVDDYAKSKLAEYPDVLEKDYPCEFPSHLYVKVSFEASKPNPDVLGVLTLSDEFLGGAHPDYNYHGYNFDLTTGKEITIKNLFPNTRDGISKLYAYAYNDLCNKTARHDPVDRVLEGRCGQDRRAPAKLLATSGGLDKLGHMMLTEDGVLLSFHSYELWSWSQGSLDLLIPARDMIAMGAHDYWFGGFEAVGNPE
jgi:hypothetical protein